MKKSLLFCLAVLLIAACAKKEQTPSVDSHNRIQTKAGETVTIKVTLPEVELLETKTGLSLNARGGLDPSFSEGDKLLVGKEIFTLVSFEGKSGVFSGKASDGGPGGDCYTIRYPASSDQATPLVQEADGSLSHISYSATLENVDSYSDIHFSYGWAAAHNGRFLQSGVLQLVLNLPDVATDVSTVKFEGEDIAPLDLQVKNGALNNHSFTAYLPCGKIELDSSKEVKITVTASDGETFTNSFIPGTQTLHDSHLIRLVTSPSKWNRVLSGQGSETNPYLITTVDDFDNIRNLISENTYTHFRMLRDIDFSSVQNWVPINIENKAFGIVFDGDGHKVTHFKCSYSNRASIFGILHGTVKNLIVEDSQINTTASSPCGTVAAWVGNSDSSLQGSLENVHVVRGSVSCSASTPFGGLSGRSGGGTFTNCSFDGTISRPSVSEYNSSYYPVGGILGEALDGVSISGCKTSGTLTTASGRACGGILGKCSSELDIKDCESTMVLTARDDVAGGIVGYYGSGTISGCKVKTDITVKEKGSGTSYVGGIAAHSGGSAHIVRCSFEGTLTGPYGVVGGIMGQCNATTGDGAVIEECYSAGKIVSGSTAGGIMGRSSEIGLVIRDCGSTMDVESTGSSVGGVLGDAPKNTSISRCFAAGNVIGTFGVGGLIGRAFGRQSSSGNLNNDVKTSVEYCLAFNPSVKSCTSGGENPASHYSGGAVIGCSSRPNTLRSCLRNPTMVFQFYSDASLNVLFDHEDSSPESPLAQPAGSAKWFSPYHGKAAPAGSTTSSAAKSLGWPETVWNLSGEIPVLAE